MSCRSGAKYDDDLIQFSRRPHRFLKVVGFLVGLVIALRLAFRCSTWGWNGPPSRATGRCIPSAGDLRLRWHGADFDSFYIVQRTCRALPRAAGLAKFVFWGYQLFIVLAATGYVLGITQSRAITEPGWYVDLWLTLVLGGLPGRLRRHDHEAHRPHIYVANWFFLSFIITVAMRTWVNNVNACRSASSVRRELSAVGRRAGRAGAVGAELSTTDVAVL